MTAPGWVRDLIVDDDPDQGDTSHLDDLDGVGQRSALCPAWLVARRAMDVAAPAVHAAMSPAEVLDVAMPGLRGMRA